MHHYLVVANQTLGGDALRTAISDRLAEGDGRFHVLVPATPPHDLYSNVLNALEGELPDEALARAAALVRLEDTVRWIRDRGGTADGEVGVADPLAAIGAALDRGSFDEVIISTLPTHLSQWVHLDLPSRVRHAYDVPVVHVVAP